ncbi:GtrA family protein [Litchfieldia salsa]|uniref:Putative flippase GtrA (Transmembrane translocase of bactoprenol-linked glucose) n=1 Tax=Litchfieldia salsa TaxID=930152 RepID=A0A1H0UB02_9BACI|nr:GtrA family protein [Litchfieldia salsa]SDP63492.1 Putative flippase GtrA (transmembrane translocase of bactoprenol-linked glucose) [Litchfieldia salsa]
MKIKKEVINYLIFGILTTAINIISFWLFNKTFGLDYRIATSLAWILSVAFAFITNKLYVFNSNHLDKFSVMKEFTSFIFFRLLSFILDIFTMVLLVGLLQMDSLIAKLIANVFVVIFNYFASKYIVFKPIDNKV